MYPALDTRTSATPQELVPHEELVEAVYGEASRFLLEQTDHEMHRSLDGSALLALSVLISEYLRQSIQGP